MKGSRLALVCLSIFLGLFPLTVGKPGLPTGFKADEPAYYLMALSLARDGDLRCEPHDLRRLYDEFPYHPPRNVIVMSDDGWRNVYYGKPYAYSLLAAPLTALFGANGMVATNMLLLLAMIWMGAIYLGRFNGEALAAAFSAGYFLLSSAFAYAFWLHPEIFMMASGMGCLFLTLHRFRAGPRVGPMASLRSALISPGARAALSGALLALGSYHKPALSALGIVALYAFWRRHGWRTALLWLLAALLAMGALAGFAYALTGHPSAYLGVQRAGFSIHNPDVMPIQPQPLREEPNTRNSWTWIFRIPEIDGSQLADSVQSFLWGRHTGLLPYMPFAVLSTLLFLLNGWRSRLRWLLLTSLGLVAFFFILWIPFNWHGGGGFVGNRYFVIAFPGFLFLVTSIRPRWSVLLGYALGALFLGTIVFTPFGAPVRHPTLQSHVRGHAFRLLPQETVIYRRIPGYDGHVYENAWFRGRKDHVSFRGAEIWLHGATEVELWVVVQEPLETLLFEVRTPAPGNRIRLRMPGVEETLDFRGAERRGELRRLLRLTPGAPERIDPVESPAGWLYTLLVESETGRLPRNRKGAWTGDGFYLGAALRYLGTEDALLSPERYRLRWGTCDAPSSVSRGAEFKVTTRVTNLSDHPWVEKGMTRTTLSYHWLQTSGRALPREGKRTPLPSPIEPRETLRVEQLVEAPETPGSYTLSIDLVREEITWFGERNGGVTCDVPVEVRADS